MHRISLRLAFYVVALIMLVAAAPQISVAQTAPTLTVDAAGNPHPINPDIYASRVTAWTLASRRNSGAQYPVGRRRNNPLQLASRLQQLGFDWYFMGGNGQATLSPRLCRPDDQHI